MSLQSSTRMPEKHGVVAILKDNQGRFLFIRRGLTLPRAPGFWCFAGGEMEAGETQAQAIVREVKEEVGLSVLALYKVHESISPNAEYRLHWWQVEMQPCGQQLTLHEVEVAEARWLKLKDALKLEPLLPTLKLWLAEKGVDKESANF